VWLDYLLCTPEADVAPSSTAHCSGFIVQDLPFTRCQHALLMVAPDRGSVGPSLHANASNDARPASPRFSLDRTPNAQHSLATRA